MDTNCEFPRGLKPGRSDQTKTLTAHLKVRPFKKSAETDFFATSEAVALQSVGSLSIISLKRRTTRTTNSGTAFTAPSAAQ